MSLFQSVDLYDPESPSVDDDLGLELDQSCTCKICKSGISSSHRCETENADSNNNDNLSVAESSNNLVVSPCTTAGHDKQEHHSDVMQTEEHVNPVLFSKPAVIWKSTEAKLAPVLKEFDDLQTVEDDIEKASPLNVESTVYSPDFDDDRQSQSSQQKCSSTSSDASDTVKSAVSDDVDTGITSRNSSVSEPVTVTEVDSCDTNGDHTNAVQKTDTSVPGSDTNNVVEIADPAEPEPDGSDQVTTFSQPHTIELNRIVEGPSEPDELLQTTDPSCDNAQVHCLRIIRLDRDTNVQLNPLVQLYDSDISDPDFKPPGEESCRIIPREIKLNRDVAASKHSFHSFAFHKNSSSLIKPRIIKLNSLYARTDAPLVIDLESDACTEVVPGLDTPLSPSASVVLISDSDSEGDERQVPEPFILRDDTSDDDDCYDATDVENTHSLLHTQSSGVTASNHRYLSDGEIVDDDEEEETGIFQLPVSAPFSREEKENSEQHKEKHGKKRHHEPVSGDAYPQHDSPEEAPDSSKRKKQQKVKNSCRPKSQVTFHINEESMSAEVQHLIRSKSKADLKSSSKKKCKRHKTKQTSRSPEKLLVGYGHNTKRKVVVVDKTDDAKKDNYQFLPYVTVSDEISPSLNPLHERTLNSDVLNMPKRALKKKKQHHKHHTHAHKHKMKHKKHRHRRQLSDVEGSFDESEYRHNRSRTRSYDRIVEMIRSEQRQSPHLHHLRSVVVHKNMLVSARQRSLSCSSNDSYHSLDNTSSTDVFQNIDSRSRNASGGHMHLSRLSYSGEVEPDVRNTLLGECIKSKYGPDYDISFISRNLSTLCSNNDDADDEVEILGVSYLEKMQSKNSNLTNADITSELRDKGSNCAAVSVHMEERSSATGEASVNVKCLLNSNIGADKVESDNVMVLSKEVQTQVSLLAETRETSQQNKPLDDHGKADKELQVSGLDTEECIHSPAVSRADDHSATMAERVSFSEAECGIQSPESHVEEDSHVPRPVLLERTDAPKPTPDSPQRDYSDIFVTVRNVPNPLLRLSKTIAHEPVADDHSPKVSMSSTNITLKNAAEQFQLGVNTEIGTVSALGLGLGKSTTNASEQLSFKSSDMPVQRNASSKEHPQLVNRSAPVTAPALHHLPPIIHYRPVQHQRAVPLRRVNPTFIEKPALNGSSSTHHLPEPSDVQQLHSEPVVTTSCSGVQSQQPLITLPLAVHATDSYSASTTVNGVSSSSIPHQVQHENQTKSCAPELSESLSFFTLKSDRIPGICEDLEPDCESRTGTSFSGGFLPTSGSLGVINLPVTAAGTRVLGTQHQTVVPSCTVASYGLATSHMASTQAENAFVRHYVPRGTVFPTVTTSTGSSASPSIASGLLPLLGTIATCLLRTPLQQQTTTVSARSTASSIVPTVSSTSSLVNVPALNCATTTVSSTDAVSAWITSLPQNPQPSIQQLPKPTKELDFDVDAVESPLSDEIMSFSPPSSEHMMAVVKMKHTLGLQKKSSKNEGSGFKRPNKTEVMATDKEEMMKRVSCQFKLIMQPYYRSGKITKEEYKDVMRKAVPAICHSKSRDTSKVKMVRYADQYVHKVLMMRKYLAKKNANTAQNHS